MATQKTQFLHGAWAVNPMIDIDLVIDHPDTYIPIDELNLNGDMNWFFYRKERLLICKMHKLAFPPHTANAHFYNMGHHHLQEMPAVSVKKVFEKVCNMDNDDHHHDGLEEPRIDEWWHKDGFELNEPLEPFILYHGGYLCNIQGCKTVSSTKKGISTHLRKFHQTKYSQSREMIVPDVLFHRCPGTSLRLVHVKNHPKKMVSRDWLSPIKIAPPKAITGDVNAQAVIEAAAIQEEVDGVDHQQQQDQDRDQQQDQHRDDQQDQQDQNHQNHQDDQEQKNLPIEQEIELQLGDQQHEEQQQDHHHHQQQQDQQIDAQLENNNNNKKEISHPMIDTEEVLRHPELYIPMEELNGKGKVNWFYWKSERLFGCLQHCSVMTCESARAHWRRKHMGEDSRREYYSSLFIQYDHNNNDGPPLRNWADENLALDEPLQPFILYKGGVACIMDGCHSVLISEDGIASHLEREHNTRWLDDEMDFLTALFHISPGKSKYVLVKSQGDQIPVNYHKNAANIPAKKKRKRRESTEAEASRRAKKAKHDPEEE